MSLPPPLWQRECDLSCSVEKVHGENGNTEKSLKLFILHVSSGTDGVLMQLVVQSAGFSGFDSE